MKFSRNTFTLMLTAFLLALPAAVIGSDADSITGIWNTAENDAGIQIYKCGAEYCGRLLQLQHPNYPPNEKDGMAGLPMVDRNNPNPELRKRPLLGMTFIDGFRYAGHNTWEGGRIYNAEDGKTYKAKISLSDGNHLQLRGYWGISLLGRTETWVRSTSDPNA